MKIRILRGCICLSSLALLLGSGCARTATSVTRPSELHALKGNKKRTDGYSVAYDARGRGAYIVRAATESQDGRHLKRSGLVFCAEPPPDAAANLTARRDVDASVDAMVTLKAVEAAVKGGGKSSESATSEIADVATRTELVLLMRDALYRVCEMNANGVLSDEDASKVMGNILATARTLGQRDNVGKLVDVLAIVARADKPHDPKLVDSLVSTIRLVVLGDQLMQSNEGARLVAESILVTMMASEINALNDPESKRMLLAAMVAMLNQLKAEEKREREEVERMGTLKSEKDRTAYEAKRAELESLRSTIKYLEGIIPR